MATSVISINVYVFLATEFVIDIDIRQYRCVPKSLLAVDPAASADGEARQCPSGERDPAEADGHRKAQDRGSRRRRSSTAVTAVPSRARMIRLATTPSLVRR